MEKILQFMQILAMIITYPFAMAFVLLPIGDQPVSASQKVIAVIVSGLYLLLAMYMF